MWVCVSMSVCNSDSFFDQGHVMLFNLFQAALHTLDIPAVHEDFVSLSREHLQMSSSV